MTKSEEDTLTSEWLWDGIKDFQIKVNDLTARAVREDHQTLNHW